MINKNILKQAGHVARMEEGNCVFKILSGKPTIKRSFRKNNRKLLECILKKQVSMRGIELIQLRIGIIGGSM